MVYQRFNGGWIELICGCMFSGKSEELIRRVKRAEIAKQQIRVFYHQLDTRQPENYIASHSGFSLEAEAVEKAADILALVGGQTQVVAIDEAQFFDWSIAEVCNELADRGVRVIVAGLDMDFRAEPFGPMPLLLAQIDGQPASYEDPVIMVGASEVYEARCRVCHEVPRREKV